MLTINRRTFMGGTLAGATFLTTRAQSLAQAAPLPPHEQELYEAAKREGEITWYTAHISADPSEAAGRVFSERYPGIKVNVVRTSSQVAFQRLSQDMRAGAPQADVFSSVNFSHYTLLKRQENLMQFRPRNADGIIPVARNADPDDFFHTVSAVLILMGHNVKSLPEAEAPKRWKDIADPRFKGQMAVGHPSFSATIATLAIGLRKQYGWDLFKAFEKNRPQIGRSADDPVNLMNVGERNVGVGVAVNTMLLSMSRGNPLRMIYPEEGTLAIFAPSAIPKNAPHPNAAKLFMEFSLSPHYAAAVRPFFVHSLRPEVPPPDGALAVSDTKLLLVDPADVEAGMEEVKEMWKDMFGV